MSKAENPNQGQEIEIISINQREIELLEKNRKINLQKLFTPEGMDAIIEEILKEVSEFSADVTTKKGRAEIVSMAAKIAKCKSPIEKLAKEAKDESQKIISGIQYEWKRYEAKMDLLRDAVRKPVDEIEEKEAAELKVRQDQIALIEQYRHANFANSPSMYEDSIKQIRQLMQFSWGDDWTFRAENAANEIIAILEEKAAAAKKYQEEQAELAQLKKEKAERDQKDHEAAIAAEAARKAKFIAEMEAAKKAKELRENAEKEKIEAEQARLKIEEEKKAAEQAKINAELRVKEAERLAIEQAERAESARIEAERKAKEDAEKAAAEAVKREQERVAEEKRVADLAAEKLAVNKKHRAKINNEALDAIRKIAAEFEGSPVDLAKSVIEAIAKGEVPHVQINY